MAFADINFEGAKMSAEKSNGFAKNSSYQSFAIQVDVADVDSVQSMVDRMVEKFGRIDYLVHSAGVSRNLFSLFFDDSSSFLVKMTLREHYSTLMQLSNCILARSHLSQANL